MYFTTKDIQTCRKSQCRRGVEGVDPLDPDNLEPPAVGIGGVRLLTLHPGEASEDIIISFPPCTIDIAVLPHCEYVAISYAWKHSSSENAHNVICEGKLFPVNETLHTALEHLRSETEYRALWIDTICINQDEVNERRAMLRTVPSIFEHAQKIIAWLGPQMQQDKDALRIIERLDCQAATDGPWWRRITMKTKSSAPFTAELLAPL